MSVVEPLNNVLMKSRASSGGVRAFAKSTTLAIAFPTTVILDAWAGSYCQNLLICR